MIKPLQEKTNVIVDYIRQKTKDSNDWISIGNRDIPRIFGISQLYASRLLESIKAHPNIIYKIDDKFPTRFKPYMFKWAEDKKKKIEAGLSPAQFYWLSEEEVNQLKNVNPENDYEATARVMRLCNLLVSEGAKEWWTAINIDTMSDFIVASQRETKTVINQLIKANILVKAEKHGLYRLVLDSSLYDAIKKEAEADEVQTKPKQKRKPRKTKLDITPSIDEENTHHSIPQQNENIGVIETDIDKISSIDKNNLALSIHDQKEIIEENVFPFDEKVNILELDEENTANTRSKSIKALEIDPQSPFKLAMENVKILEQETRDGLNKILWQRIILERLIEKEKIYEQKYNDFAKLEKEHIALKKQLIEIEKDYEQEHNNFTKLEEEYTTLKEQFVEKEKICERDYEVFIKLKEGCSLQVLELEKANEKSIQLEKRVRELESESKLLREYNDRVMEYAQARMDVMLGQFSSLIDEFVHRPTYEKKDEVVTARLKKNAFGAVLGTIDEIINYKPESKAVPDLK